MAVSDLRVPRYHQIYLILRERISDGTYAQGKLIPGEYELAANFGVSRITSRRALDELGQAGLVTREQGRGTVVTNQPSRGSLNGTLDSLMASNRLIGESDARILDLALVDGSPEALRAFGDAEGAKVYRIERVRTRDGVPFCHVTAYVPRDIGCQISRVDLEHNMLVTLIERAGADIDRAEQQVTATIADPKIAVLLGIDVGSPLLRVMRTVFDRKGRAVEYVSILFRPDHYRIEMSLSRDDNNGADEETTGETGAFRISA